MFLFYLLIKSLSSFLIFKITWSLVFGDILLFFGRINKWTLGGSFLFTSVSRSLCGNIKSHSTFIVFLRSKWRFWKKRLILTINSRAIGRLSSKGIQILICRRSIWFLFYWLWFLGFLVDFWMSIRCNINNKDKIL